MIVNEYFMTREDGVVLNRTYSDAGFYILQNETGIEYSEAVDVEGAPYTYSETDRLIEIEEEELMKVTYADSSSSGSVACFVSGTPVMVSLDGEVMPIDKIKAEDTVVSYNPETGENYVACVTKLIVNENSTDMTKVTLDNGTILEMTAVHPVLTKNGFRAVSSWGDFPTLIAGDEAKTLDGWSKIVNIERYTLNTPINTYTLAISDYNESPDIDVYDNFYANGVVVHNKASGS